MVHHHPRMRNTQLFAFLFGAFTRQHVLPLLSLALEVFVSALCCGVCLWHYLVSEGVFLLLLAVMASQERSLKRRYSETWAVCVSSPSGASSAVEVLVPLSCSTRRSSTSSKQVSTSSKQVSGASPAFLLSVGKRDSTVVRPPLAKLVSSEQPAETGGGSLLPKILVLRRKTHSTSRGGSHSGLPTLAAPSGSTPAMGEEEPRSRAARLSASVFASGRDGCSQGQSSLPGEVTPLTLQE
jgi:hypothetical protein